MTKTVVALIYDFDKTLATDDMQAFSFIPNLGMTSAEFWKETGDFAKKTGTESTLAYLHTMIKECKEKGVQLFMPDLRYCGDNAAMIASQGYYEFLAGHTADETLNAYANMSIEENPF